MQVSLSRKLGIVLVAGVFWALGSGDAQAHFPLFDLPGPIVEPKEPLEIDMSYGHFFLGDRYPAIRPDWVGVAVAGGRPRDYTGAVTSTTDIVPRWRLRFTPRKGGDHVFGWHAGMFEERPERKVLDFCKVVLHARTTGGGQTGWDRALGSPLEIMPLTRPYSIPVGSVFRGRVVRHVDDEQGGRFKVAKPMSGMFVEGETRSRPLPRRAAYLPNFRLNVKTDADGVFAVTLPQKGWWMLSAATDGGPGQQGTSRIVQRRAVLLVHVGDTVWETPDPEPQLSETLQKLELEFGYTGTLRDCLTEFSGKSGITIKVREVVVDQPIALAPVKGTAAEICDAIAGALGLAWRRVDGCVEFYTA